MGAPGKFFVFHCAQPNRVAHTHDLYPIDSSVTATSGVSEDRRTMEKPSQIEAFGNRWFLLRTNAGRERVAQNQIRALAVNVLLPLVKVRVHRWGELIPSVSPLFPGYLFAHFNFEDLYSQIRYTRGVRDILHFGIEPAVVPDWVIEEVERRCANGPIELLDRMLVPNERVVVVQGPLKEFDGIFERYLSGRERVAVLLSTMNGGTRAVLPSSMIMPMS